jgi:hypothetical protein
MAPEILTLGGVLLSLFVPDLSLPGTTFTPAAPGNSVVNAPLPVSFSAPSMLTPSHRVTYHPFKPSGAPALGVARSHSCRNGEGSCFNPETGKSLRPDLGHAPPIGPQWDWKDPGGKKWRIPADGGAPTAK